MNENALPLDTVYEGWQGYQQSLVNAIAPRTKEELGWRAAAGLRSMGELAHHIAFGRVDWFGRMGVPGAIELGEKAEAWSAAVDAAELVRQMEDSWLMVAAVLAGWTTDDLSKTYLQPYQGKIYAVSRQWTIWRIMAHDIHHGGQMSMLLFAQGISIPELGDLGGHLTEPPLAKGL